MENVRYIEKTKNKIAAATVAAGLALSLTACGGQSERGGSPYNAQIVESDTDSVVHNTPDLVYVELTDGRVLECLQSDNLKGSVLDCNWEHPVIHGIG